MQYYYTDFTKTDLNDTCKLESTWCVNVSINKSINVSTCHVHVNGVLKKP